MGSLRAQRTVIVLVPRLNQALACFLVDDVMLIGVLSGAINLKWSQMMSVSKSTIIAVVSVFSVITFGLATAEQAPKEWSRTQPYPEHDVYYPGTEALAPDEMRVIACGTGMPTPRLKQAAGCFLVELGNGEKFIFDMGEGSYERLAALGIPLDQLDKVFLGHLHLDHAGDFPAFYFTGPVNPDV